MRHLRNINEEFGEFKKMPSSLHEVYYLPFNKFTKEEQKILREYTDAQQNGYADLIDIQEPDHDDVHKMLVNKGYSIGDEVLIHYKW